MPYRENLSYVQAAYELLDTMGQGSISDYYDAELMVMENPALTESKFVYAARCYMEEDSISDRVQVARVQTRGIVIGDVAARCALNTAEVDMTALEMLSGVAVRANSQAYESQAFNPDSGLPQLARMVELGAVDNPDPEVQFRAHVIRSLVAEKYRQYHPLRRMINPSFHLPKR